MKLSVVIPCYNESPTVQTLLSRVTAAALPAVFTSLEIVVVDDLSDDGTRNVLQRISASPAAEIGLRANQTFKAIYLDSNGGKGRALRHGFLEITGDVVLVQDADLEYNPQDYSALLAPIARGDADVVLGSRFIGLERRVLYFHHYMVNKLFTFISNCFTNLNITDMECCYKVFRREVLNRMTLVSNRFGFEPEVTAKVAKLSVRVYEVGISYHGRTYEEGKKITWQDGVAALWHIFRFNIFG